VTSTLIKKKSKEWVAVEEKQHEGTKHTWRSEVNRRNRFPSYDDVAVRDIGSRFTQKWKERYGEAKRAWR
jgi:hypothetical protein